MFQTAYIYFKAESELILILFEDFKILLVVTTET